MSGDSAVEPKSGTWPTKGSTETTWDPLPDGHHNTGDPPPIPDGYHIGTGTPPPATRSIPVTIYLEDETDYAAVKDAIQNVLDSAGAHLENQVS
jgi:hypothetical protein